MSAEVSSAAVVSPEADGDSHLLEEPRSNGEDGSPEKGSKSSAVDQKICGVCGDKALGNNFNAITCESCKAFFRRNALRAKVFVCPFSNNCKVDAVTRRFCQKCRLKKCHDIGMRKDWIMTDEEKRIKKQKIEQNRLKRTGENSGCVSGSNSPGENLDVALPPAAKVQILEVQRGVSGTTAPSNNDLETNGTPIGEPEIANAEGVMTSTKFQKQPMGPHNHNNNASDSIFQKKIKERLHGMSTAVSGRNQYPDDQDGYEPINLHHANYDSLSTVSVQPNPPLLSNVSKYPPNKRQLARDKFYMAALENETDEARNQSNEPYNQTPLLSSLISPGYPESSPDPISSPQVPAVEADEDASPNINGRDYPIVQTISVIQQQHHQQQKSPQQRPLASSVIINNDISAYHDEMQAHHRYDYSQPPPPQIQTYHTKADYEDKYDASPSSYSSGEISNPAQGCDSETPRPVRNTMDSILSIAIAAEFNAFGVLGTNLHSRELNKAEQAKLNELLLASQALHAPVDAERPIKVSESSDPSLLNVINLTEIAIRRLIKMAKKISGFKNMCQEDQIALLKGGSTEMMILRSTVTYDPDRDSWQIPHSNPGQYNINLGVLKEARGNLYEEHQRFLKSFRAHWRQDENIMIILCAITLFTPERLNVIHKDVVKLEQDSYYYLLKRYLESILNGCEAKSTYLQLISKVAELRALNSSHVRVFLEMNPKEVEPLLIEIFDLK